MAHAPEIVVRLAVARTVQCVSVQPKTTYSLFQVRSTACLPPPCFAYMPVLLYNISRHCHRLTLHSHIFRLKGRLVPFVFAVQPSHVAIGPAAGERRLEPRSLVRVSQRALDRAVPSSGHILVINYSGTTHPIWTRFPFPWVVLLSCHQ
jgi:hypothetical protein